MSPSGPVLSKNVGPAVPAWILLDQLLISLNRLVPLSKVREQLRPKRLVLETILVVRVLLRELRGELDRALACLTRCTLVVVAARDAVGEHVRLDRVAERIRRLRVLRIRLRVRHVHLLGCFTVLAALHQRIGKGARRRLPDDADRIR